MNDFIHKYGGHLEKVSIDALTIHPKAKAIYGHRDIESLCDDFKYGHGMQQNILTNKKKEIISGNRRFLAAKMAGWTYLFVYVLETLPEEDEEYCIVCSNKTRVKTSREKYHELQVFLRELPKRQGQRPKEGAEPYDQRKAIATAMGKDVSEAEVRDLMVFNEATEGLLECIDNDNVYLTPLAAGVRKLNEALDLSKYVPVQEVDLDLCSCPFCRSTSTARIEIIDGKLYYV